MSSGPPGSTPTFERAARHGQCSLAQLLASFRYRSENEKQLQLGIAEVLRSSDVPFEREVSIGPGCVIDFLVLERGLRTGVEVKIGGRAVEVIRQLHRYAASPQVDALLLVTTLLRLSRMPPSLQGKPLRVLALPVWT